MPLAESHLFRNMSRQRGKGMRRTGQTFSLKKAGFPVRRALGPQSSASSEEAQVRPRGTAVGGALLGEKLAAPLLRVVFSLSGPRPWMHRSVSLR